MVRFISNEDIEASFPLETYLPVADELFSELGAGRASCTPKMTTHTEVQHPGPEAEGPAFHAMRAAGGAIQRFGVSAVRLNSDIKHWPTRGGTQVQERIPIADDMYNGLVFLFSTETGELLAIFPDGIIQTYHVAGGIAMGAKYLANPDASVLGVYGSGHQATAHVRALDSVLSLDEVRVYSPTTANRRSFAETMDAEVDAAVRSVDDPEAVCEADVVNCATNSTQPVFEAEWIRPGTHLNYIRPAEVPNDLLDPAVIDLFAISTVDQRSMSITGPFGTLGHHDEAADPWYFYPLEVDPIAPKLRNLSSTEPAFDRTDIVRLPAIVHDESLGRSSTDDITVFSQIGDSVAFAAIGHALYEVAQEEDLGEVIPMERYMQEYVP